MPPLCASLVQALNGPTEVTLVALIQEYGWQDRDTLDVLLQLRQTITAWDFECAPPVGASDLESKRVIKRKILDLKDVILAEVEQGEGAALEFKETLLLDVQKLDKSGMQIEDCASEKILYASLKTIAAFLNSGGGVLLIGVSDGGEISGIDKELKIIPGNKKSDLDGWELYLRNKIESCFVDGRSIGASIHVENVQLKSFKGEFCTVVRISVGKRSGLCILKEDNFEKLYLRTGNRTVSVKLSELEKFFSLGRL